jgi:hypothetical protein
MVKQQQRSTRRVEYVIRIGPELMEIIEKQMEKIKDITYGVVKDSPWEAGEIIAKKFKGEV